MFFSVLSVMTSLTHASTQTASKSSKSQGYNKRKIFKMKIECEKLKKHHKYTHKKVRKTICSTLGIDDNGSIQVFYIIPAHNSLVVYMEVYDVTVDIIGK